MSRPIRLGVLSALAAVVAATAASGRAAPPRAREVLSHIAPTADAEWSAIERGEPLARMLDTDSREIAVVGAVRIRASSDRLVERYRAVENLKRSAIVLDVGRFGQPPQSSDLQAASFEPYSLDLRDCRQFDCRVRLSEADIVRFQRDVDWTAPDWQARSAGTTRGCTRMFPGDDARMDADTSGGRSADARGCLGGTKRGWTQIAWGDEAWRTKRGCTRMLPG